MNLSYSMANIMCACIFTIGFIILVYYANSNSEVYDIYHSNQQHLTISKYIISLDNFEFERTGVNVRLNMSKEMLELNW
jgi:hypothetical protein